MNKIIAVLLFVTTGCASSVDDGGDFTPTPEPRTAKGIDSKEPTAPAATDDLKMSGVTSGGVKYEILRKGTGVLPLPDDTLECHYEGKLENGTVFDSSYVRGTTFKFKVNQVIKGWKEALLIMPLGSKWKITVPPHLAYGKKGAGKLIGPDETLIFTIELLSVQNSK
ncbi:MAG: FKBP-type peptidyl-prolyl cis-trans isomerase [Deltaproteobacteria bacterium]|nr:FKBP-type peptidyl-prolyl cis-trans isomerase [Deltaproteobacteria bacterium]